VDDGEEDAPARDGVEVGDGIILLFSDDQRRISLHLTEATHDLEKGLLSSTSPLKEAVLGVEEGDEIEFEQVDGNRRKALIESINEGLLGTPFSRERGDDAPNPVA
jgi:transcription elongation GreA/GreB family factor